MNQEAIIERLRDRLGADAAEHTVFRGQAVVVVPKEKLRAVCRFLRDDPALGFDHLSFVGGVDRFPAAPRFEVVYQLYSIKKNHRLRIKARIEESSDTPPSIDSVVEIWSTADWHERETAEMFGLKFNGHPDPRKLLLPDEWTVHPLRKDFPLEGSEADTPDLPPTYTG
jgi:NADH-quinone oxidoreductase subunit C